MKCIDLVYDNQQNNAFVFVDKHGDYVNSGHSGLCGEELSQLWDVPLDDGARVTLELHDKPVPESRAVIWYGNRTVTVEGVHSSLYVAMRSALRAVGVEALRVYWVRFVF